MHIIPAKPLTGQTFLITRPARQAKNLCQLLENYGGKTIVLPTLLVTPLDSHYIANTIAAISHPIDKVIFTSVNAVYPVMPLWPTLQTEAVFAVGPATAKALAIYHIAAELPAEPDFNSQGLLNLPDFQSIKDQHMVIFSGIGGRMSLYDTLRQRGANVEKIAVYQRQRPTEIIHFPLPTHVTLVISTSEEGLKNLWEITDEKDRIWLGKQRLLVVSQAMAQLATQLGCNQPPIVAANASDAAILQAILDGCKTRE